MDFNLDAFIPFDDQFDIYLLEINNDNKIVGFYPKNARTEAWRRNRVNADVFYSFLKSFTVF